MNTMKRLSILMVIFFVSSYVYSQDLKQLKKCDEQYEKNLKKIENLQNDTANAHSTIAQLNADIEKLNTSSKNYNDKIKELTSRSHTLTSTKNTLLAEKRGKTNTLNNLLKEYKRLHTDVEDLKRSSDNLDEQIRDEQSAYNSDVNDSDKKKLAAKNTGIDNGKKDVRNSIAHKYDGKTLDDLVNMDIYSYIKDDVSVIDSEDKSVDAKMLAMFYEVKNCLNVKYDEQMVAKSTESLGVVIRNYAQKNANSIEARKLKDLLVDYKDINDAFVALVDSLDTYNQKEITGDPDKVIKKKKSYYMRKISDFIGFYDNYDQYPYICDRLFKIISIKSREDGVNENVGYLLD